MRQSYFVVGTHTEIGKTVTTVALLNYLNEKAYRAFGCKPIAAGSINTPEGLRNEDALALQKASHTQWPYSQINPFLFNAYASPNIAVHAQNQFISLEDITEVFKSLCAEPGDILLIEGAGGWYVPLNHENHTWADVIKKTKIPVLLVVGLYLGCINHALLTYRALQSEGVQCAGWIINHVDPNLLFVEGVIETLKQNIDFPLLGYVPYQKHTTPLFFPTPVFQNLFA